MKRSFAIVFILLYTVILVRPVVPLVDYYFRMEAYKERCVNKSRPALHCNGQCHLKKQLKAVNTDSQEPIAPAPVKLSSEDFPVAVTEFASCNTTFKCVALKRSRKFDSPMETQSAFSGEIFHPPVSLL
jgi:hypothetical protein